MKDFRFRGEGVESGEWVYGDLIVINRYSYILPQHHRYGVSLEQIYQKLVPVIASTVCRYAGLKDKNGKEIYQMDIIRSWSLSLEVSRWNQTKRPAISQKHLGREPEKMNGRC